MTNLAFELDPLELEDEEAELGEQSGSAKTSVSSVTTSPPHGKRIPFFKKVILTGFLQEGRGQGPALWQGEGAWNRLRCTSLILWDQGFLPRKREGVECTISAYSLTQPQEAMVLAIEVPLPLEG